MALTNTRTVTATMARTEFLVFLLAWAIARLVPKKASHARKAIRQAIDQEVLVDLTFYGMDAEDRCCTTLRLELDTNQHREELLAHPRVQIGSTWTEQVAPDLRHFVDTFEELVLRCGLTVKVLMQLRKDADLVVDGRPLRRVASPKLPLMLGTSSYPVSRLPELSIQYAVDADLSEDTDSSET